MNMQLFHCLARRAGMLSLAALPVIGIVGPSEAEPGGLAGSWSGGGWVSFASGSKEKARCHAHYSGGGGSYTVTATCATASGKANCSPEKPATNRPPRISPRASSWRKTRSRSRHFGNEPASRSSIRRKTTP